MRNLGIFLVLLCALWLVGFLFENKQTTDVKFMSVQHTNICRAVAAIIIILQHVSGRLGIRYFTPLGGIGVAIFLILSGYGLNESYKKKKSWGGTWKPKISRVLIPYAIVSIVVITMQFLTRTKIEIPYYWYLDFMFFQYLVFYLTIAIPKLYTKRYFVLCVVSTVTFIGCSCTANGLRAEQAISFLVGVWISDNYEKVKKCLLNPIVLMTLLISGTLLLVTKQIPAIRMHEGEILWQGIQLVMKVSFAMAVIGEVYRARRLFNNGFITLVGGIAYELYLVHFRLLGLPQKGVLGMCIFLGVSIVGAWSVNKISNYIKKRIC